MVLPHGLSLEAVRSAAEVVGRATGCRLIALFGSAARRESGGAEDIDLAVLGSGPIDLVDVTNRLIRALGTQAVDVADLRTADPLLLMLVAREGSAALRGGADRVHPFRLARRPQVRRNAEVSPRGTRATARLPGEADGRLVTELDVALVRRKLSLIARNLEDLRPIAALPLTEYRRDRFRRKGVERLLQETIEAAVDVNLHCLRGLGQPTPGDYFESFLAAGRAGPIPNDLAERLAPSAGLRDRLVHEYDGIDDAIVLRAVGEAVRSFTEYVVGVETKLRERGV